MPASEATPADGVVTETVQAVDRGTGVTIITTIETRPGGGAGVTAKQAYVRGLLVAEQQPGVAGVRVHAYDGAGRRLSTADPLSGTRTWTYLADGRVSTRADGGGQVETLHYYDAASWVETGGTGSVCNSLTVTILWLKTVHGTQHSHSIRRGL